MVTLISSQSSTADRARAAFSAWLVAFALLGSTQTLLGLTEQLSGMFAVYNMGHFLALGLAAGSSAAAIEFATSKSQRRRSAGLVVLSGAFCWLAIGPVLTRWSARLAAQVPIPRLLVLVSVTIGVALLIPFIYELGGRARSGRPALLVSTPLAVGSQLLNSTMLPRVNPGVHLVLAVLGATVLASALRVWLLRRRTSKRTRRVWRPALVLAAAGALWTIAVSPSNDTRFALAKTSGSVLYPFIAAWFGPDYAAIDLDTPLEQLDVSATSWLIDRSNAPDRPATQTAARPSNPIVLLITIDAMRADLLRSPDTAAQLPNLQALTSRSMSFPNAWSPGSQTAYTLATLFSSRYFSQLRWTLIDGSRSLDPWPHGDQTPRFPELLSRHGIRTAAYLPAVWMGNDFGVIRGFDEGGFVPGGESVSNHGASHWTAASWVVEPLLDRLRRAADEPLFIYTHFIDPHAPYDSVGNPTGDPFDGYMAELAEVDRAIGRVMSTIDASGLSHRTTVIISADHGEAFGEHGTQHHAATLYEELVRVPFLVTGPEIPSGSNDTFVSLIDLGPTILDLFGLATPGISMGQSLVPTLLVGRGEVADVALSRPLAMEGRGMVGMVFSDRLKVVLNTRLGTIEVYDLNLDPGELQNMGTQTARAQEATAIVRVFFDAHRYRAAGYSMPDRR